MASGAGKGKYELKPECYSLYNPFFYHYSKVEKSKVKKKKKTQDMMEFQIQEIIVGYSGVNEYTSRESNSAISFLLFFLVEVKS